jgi:hypothetical protein
MGIVKIDDDLHEEARRASTVMCRSINAQAEFWMKIVKMQFAAAHVRLAEAAVT